MYNEYDFQAAFAVASLLALLAIATQGIKSVVEWRSPVAAHGATPEQPA